MKEKKWEKKKFKGSQLTGRTLGVIGLGRIGREVVKRGKGLQMKVLGYDPFIPTPNLEHLQIDIVELNTLLKNADIITVHTPLTESTKHLINASNIPNLKEGVYLINCARGGIYNEKDLAEALSSGRISGVGLDVFTQEPPPEDFPLYENESCIMTPHLGASTQEAQVQVALESASSLIEYFKDGVAKSSLNFPTIAVEEMDILEPWFSLVENLGDLLAQLCEAPIDSVKLRVSGSLKDLNIKPLSIALAKGLLREAFGDEVNLVNAPILAKERGMGIATEEFTSDKDTTLVEISVLSPSEKYHLRAAMNFGGGSVIQLNSIPIEFKPQGHILYIRNDDVPKVVGELGTLLGEKDINIASLQLSRDSKGGLAMTIMHLDLELKSPILDELKKKPYIKEAKYIHIL